MKSFDAMEYCPISEKLVNVLCERTQNSDPLFFRILTAYHFTKMAATMRCKFRGVDKGEIPTNLYAINLGSSGHGKGHSTNIIEDRVTHLFRERFTEETLEHTAAENLPKLAVSKAKRKGSDPDDELARLEAEYERLGPLLYSFDSASTPAIKQMRTKLLMANSGAISFECDEVGSNLLGNMDALNTFLELFDVGKIKQKLTKNTADNARSEDIYGKTPCNLLLFGTPSKLLNGSKVEDEFYAMLEAGYARRSFFGFSKRPPQVKQLTPEEYLDKLSNTDSDKALDELAAKFYELADYAHFNKRFTLPRASALLLIEYRMDCEKRADALPPHKEIEKAELKHRYFKVQKLACTYAFIHEASEIGTLHLEYAIKLAEDSGKALTSLLQRERNYVKLVNYIATVGKEVTDVDLVEDLPFYKGSAATKQELMALAITYGHKHNIIIEQNYYDGIRFLKGRTLEKTDLSKIIISYSEDIAQDYTPAEVPFDKLHKLTQNNGFHWCNHHFEEKHRKEDKAILGFNVIVLDVDSGTSLSTAQKLLSDYTYHMYTTKRHTGDLNRFRIVLPISHKLKLSAEDFKKYMRNVYEWLPFPNSVDTQTGQRSRKWLSNEGKYIYNEGKLIDALLFIPKTQKNEQRKAKYESLQSLSAVERWFVQGTGKGNRSNQLIRYALLLVDTGHDIESVRNHVLALNAKIPDKLEETEIMTTILVTASKAIHKRDTSHE